MPIFLNNKHKALDGDRIKQLEFHMHNNELHAQIATVLELARENIVSKGWNEKHNKVLKGIVEDLMFAHEHYKSTFLPKESRKQDGEYFESSA